jgi:hypothetical protein
MSVMAPRVAVLFLDADGTTPALPGTWTLAARGTVGSFPAREYRNAAGNVVVVVKLAQGTKADGTPIASSSCGSTWLREVVGRGPARDVDAEQLRRAVAVHRERRWQHHVRRI